MRQLEENLGYTFRQKALLTQALTHPSAKQSKDNQRLEFLGDAVLEFCVSELLYRKYPDAQEGDLTARRASLVCEETLSLIAKRLGLGQFVHMGHGEQQQQGREKPSILADAMEAVLAAVYLDGGADAVRGMIQRLFADEERLSAVRGRDEKGFLQEYTQAHGLALPEYEITEETGPAHDRHFVARVCVRGEPIAQGEGPSKKMAEQAAAKAALMVYERR
jgi:ribonuclease-3